MQDLATAARQTKDFFDILTATGGLRLKYRIVAGAGAADPDGLEERLIYVDISGPDADLLTDRDGELLRAMEHLCAKILRLEPDEHDRVSFDALGYKAGRASDLRATAQRGIDAVRAAGKPYTFEPMNSRERRLLHLVLSRAEDLRTESAGEGARRAVVLYPRNYRSSENNDRAQQIRERFRRR